MIRALFLLLVLLPTALVAQDPAFVDRSEALPSPHIYDGGWEHFVGGGVAVLDCNSDGLPDFFAAGGENPALLFLNEIDNGNWKFSDAGFDRLTGVTGAYPLDIEGDGNIDLMVLRVGQNHLYRGLGNCQFEDVSETYDFVSGDQWSTAFSATWIGGDQLPTLAIGNYVDRSNPEGPFEACDDNQIYRPNGSHYPAPRKLGPGFCALSVLFSDWSRSGQTDLRLSNDRHYYVRGGSEQMWRHAEDRFLGPQDNWNSMSIWGMGIASQDISGDRRPDVVLTSMGDQLMQIGTSTGFRAAPYAIGTYAQRPFVGDDGRPSTGWHAEFGDVNNDGLEDLFIAKGNVDQMPGNAMKDPNNLLLQQSDNTFLEMADKAGVATTERSRGAALVDFDRDGLLDLVVVNRRAPLEIHQNVSLNAGNWVSVLPRQSAANTFAIGAWIEMRSDGQKTVTKELTIGGGHAGGQSGPVHFGLGRSQNAEIRILWPDGEVSEWIVIEANQTVSLWRSAANALRVTTDY